MVVRVFTRGSLEGGKLNVYACEDGLEILLGHWECF